MLPATHLRSDNEASDEEIVRQNAIMMVQTDPVIRAKGPQHVAAFEWMKAYAAGVIAERRARPKNDLISHFSLAEIDGDKLTGKLSAPGRGGQPSETEIADGKVAGATVSFAVVRTFGGNSMTNKYSATLADGALKGKIFRIGHMGHVTIPAILNAIAVLEVALIELGRPVTPGAAVAAAQVAALKSLGLAK